MEKSIRSTAARFLLALGVWSAPILPVTAAKAQEAQDPAKTGVVDLISTKIMNDGDAIFRILSQYDEETLDHATTARLNAASDAVCNVRTLPVCTTDANASTPSAPITRFLSIVEQFVIMAVADPSRNPDDRDSNLSEYLLTTVQYLSRPPWIKPPSVHPSVQ